MFLLLCTLTGLTLGLTTLAAYSREKDALHPSVVVTPPFIYMLSIWPILLYTQSDLLFYLDEDQLVHVQGIYFVAVVCFCVGMLTSRPRRLGGLRSSVGDISRRGWRKLYLVGQMMGAVSLGAYVFMIYNVGGFVSAYSRVKGGGRAPSGYIGEALLFSFPAVLAIALYGRASGGRVRAKDAVLAVLFMAPHLIQGTLGGRRGPIFLAVASLVLAWFIARNRRVRLVPAVLALGLAGLSVLVVWSQRQHLYLGSGGEVDISSVSTMVVPDRLDPGNTYVAAAANILTAEYYNDFYWGYRYFVTFFIRPIPRQLWPTKYEDMGATWVYRIDDAADAARMKAAVGLPSIGGSSMPSIADVYIEFSWGVFPFYFALGWLFARMWSLHRSKGGEWTVVYAVMLALSIYLATQTFTAFAHRLLYISIPTVVIWKYWLRRGAGPRGRRLATALR